MIQLTLLILYKVILYLLKYMHKIQKIQNNEKIQNNKKIQNNESEINIKEIHELQDTEINKYYNYNETFLEIIFNEYYIYIYETIHFIIFGLF